MSIMLQMYASILAIGDELVLGQTVDTNSAWISLRLAEHAIEVLEHRTVPDDSAAITAAIRESAAHTDVLIISGGLGPTADDLTRQALADAMKVSLVQDEDSMASIKRFFDQLSREMPTRNQVQAMLPEGSQAIDNPRGTAPGIQAQLGGATIFVMPGVPHEMRGMFKEAVIPAIIGAWSSSSARGVILTTKINTFGMGESTVGQKLAELMDRQRNPRVGTTVSDGIVSVRVRSTFPDPQLAHEQLEQTVNEIHQRLGAAVFGRDDDTLGQAVFTAMKERGVTVATAESCTGGLLGAMLTDMPGSSTIFHGGWITYTNHMKMSRLDVDESVLAKHGAVSGATARQMAAAALRRAETDLGVAVTGVAGPDESENKPVGLVYLGLAFKAGGAAGDIQAVALRLRLPGDRQDVRDRAAKCALQMIRLHVLGESLSHLRWGELVTEEE